MTGCRTRQPDVRGEKPALWHGLCPGNRHSRLSPGNESTNEGTAVSQLYAPISLLRNRILAMPLARAAAGASWFDIVLKSGLVLLFGTVLYAAISTGALFHNFD